MSPSPPLDDAEKAARPLAMIWKKICASAFAWILSFGAARAQNSSLESLDSSDVDTDDVFIQLVVIIVVAFVTWLVTVSILRSFRFDNAEIFGAIIVLMLSAFLYASILMLESLGL
jgi:hypothetical protein